PTRRSSVLVHRHCHRCDYSRLSLLFRGHHCRSSACQKTRIALNVSGGASKHKNCVERERTFAHSATYINLYVIRRFYTDLCCGVGDHCNSCRLDGASNNENDDKGNFSSA